MSPSETKSSSSKSSSSTNPAVADPFFFHTAEEAESVRATRMQQLEVLQAELESLRPGARIFEGGETGTVFLLAKGGVSGVKADVKKELNGLRKSTKGKEKNELNF